MSRSEHDGKVDETCARLFQQILMPISREQALEILRRFSLAGPIEQLAERLASTPESKRPFPPDVPQPRDATTAGRDARVEFLRSLGHDIPYLTGQAAPREPEFYQGNIENYVGMAQIPVGLVGPLRINGLHAYGDYYVPLATTEGVLVASYHRGARLVTRAGGVATLTTAEQVQRAPGFAFENLAEAGRFAAWAIGEFATMQAVAATRTSHGSLQDLQIHIETRTVYLILQYHTGDAAGQNMVTICTEAVCADLMARTPVQPRHWFIESNMSGDKKATVLSFLHGRGRKVIAEVTLPRALVEVGLHTTPERMEDYWRMSFVGGVQTGSIGVSGHVANGLAALFIACGQDAACVSEASVGITRMQVTKDGDLWVGIDLPNLIVGSVGGGTRMPTAAECLRIVDCEGTGKASRFAEVAAALLLAGEISIVGALCSGDFARAHKSHGRPTTA